MNQLLDIIGEAARTVKIDPWQWNPYCDVLWIDYHYNAEMDKWVVYVDVAQFKLFTYKTEVPATV